MQRVLLYSPEARGPAACRRLQALAREVARGRDDLAVSLHIATPPLAPARIRSALARLAPELIVVDRATLGTDAELEAALRALPPGHRPRTVLLLRDLPEPDGPADPPALAAACGGYDCILVAGCAEIHDPRRALPPTAAAAAAWQFCGYAADAPSAHPRHAVRRALSIADDQPLLLITPGCCADGGERAAFAMAALARMPAAQRPRAILAGAASLPAGRQAELRQLVAQVDGLGLLDDDEALEPMIEAADVVLATAGYHVVCELLARRKRALLVPRSGAGSAQGLRAERLAAAGLVRMLDPRLLGPATMAAALQAELTAWSAQQQPAALPGAPGLHRAAAAIRELLQPPVALELAA